MKNHIVILGLILWGTALWSKEPSRENSIRYLTFKAETTTRSVKPGEPFKVKVVIHNAGAHPFPFLEDYCSWWRDWTIQGDAVAFSALNPKSPTKCTKNWPVQHEITAGGKLERTLELYVKDGVKAAEHSFRIIFGQYIQLRSNGLKIQIIDNTP